jgi:hypothetical protein
MPLMVARLDCAEIQIDDKFKSPVWLGFAVAVTDE